LGDDLVRVVRLRSDDDGVSAAVAAGAAAGLVEWVAAAAAGEREGGCQRDAGGECETGLPCGEHDVPLWWGWGQATAAARREPRRSPGSASDAGSEERMPAGTTARCRTASSRSTISASTATRSAPAST